MKIVIITTANVFWRLFISQGRSVSGKTLPEFLDTARVVRGCGPMQIEKGGFVETFSY